jgi:hypothetical protein
VREESVLAIVEFLGGRSDRDHRAWQLTVRKLEFGMTRVNDGLAEPGEAV